MRCLVKKAAVYELKNSNVLNRNVSESACNLIIFGKSNGESLSNDASARDTSQWQIWNGVDADCLAVYVWHWLGAVFAKIAC